ncbi:MAG TPA: hypothetical protein ENH10_03440, partial [Bacteroidetes bacterium]|nr:hypothetical protein [Bacteroidota bacterium]HEX04195.1 hypothetical protein [Bacteroidota bacterium]
MPAFAQIDSWVPGKYMKQAMDRIMVNAGLVELLMDDVRYMPGISVMGALFDVGEEISWTANFKGGTTYILMAAGDDDATDVDIHVSDSKGNRILEDTETDANPMLEFSPGKGGKYTVTVKLYAADASSFCSLVLMQENGVSLELEELTNCVDTGLLTAAESGFADDLAFIDEDNQWSLYGAPLGSGESITITNIHLKEDVNILLGAADSNCSDADLTLYDAYDNELESDTQTDKVPVLVYENEGG